MFLGNCELHPVYSYFFTHLRALICHRYTNCLVAMLNSRKPGQGWGSTATSSSHAQSTGSNQKQQQGSNTFSSACGYQLNDMSNTARRFTGNTVDRYQDTSANSKRNSNPYSDADQAILRIQVAKETVSDGLQRDVGGKSVSKFIIRTNMVDLIGLTSFWMYHRVITILVPTPVLHQTPNSNLYPPKRYLERCRLKCV